MKKCPRCQTELEKDEILCPNCGLYVEATEDYDAYADLCDEEVEDE